MRTVNATKKFFWFLGERFEAITCDLVGHVQPLIRYCILDKKALIVPLSKKT